MELIIHTKYAIGQEVPDTTLIELPLLEHIHTQDT